MLKRCLILGLSVACVVIAGAGAVHAAQSKPSAEMKAVLDAHASLNPKPIETLSPAEARKQPTPGDGAKLVMKQQGKNPDDSMGVTTRDITIPGPAGAIPARIYMPEGAAGKILPVIVYYHGGGWVIADLDTYDASPRALAKQVNAIVVSSHYRQAPEHKFPAAHDDAFAAYQWVASNAGSFGGDPARMALAGESAGGNLAIATAMRARDAKMTAPLHQLLVYPVAGVDMNTPSYREHANAKPLNKAMMGWFMGHVLKSESDKQDPRLDLIGKANLAGLPPATLILAEIDPLRSDGERLAEKLKQAGVGVTQETYSGAAHEFFGMAGVVDDAKNAQALSAKNLKKALER